MQSHFFLSSSSSSSFIRHSLVIILISCDSAAKNKNSARTHARSHLLFTLQPATSLHAARPYITPAQLEHACRSFTAPTLVFKSDLFFSRLSRALLRSRSLHRLCGSEDGGSVCVCVISRQAAGCNGNIANTVQHHVINKKNDVKDALNFADRSSHLVYNLQG